MIINIQDDILKLHALGLLDGMLLDKTTKQHIMWATGAYASLGGRYEYNGEITPDLITGETRIRYQNAGTEGYGAAVGADLAARRGVHPLCGCAG